MIFFEHKNPHIGTADISVRCGRTKLDAKVHNDTIIITTDAITNVHETKRCITTLRSYALNNKINKIVFFLDTYESPFSRVEKWICKKTNAKQIWTDGRFRQYEITTVPYDYR